MLGNWLLTWYLFLGGVGAGLFLVSYAVLALNCRRPRSYSPVMLCKVWPRTLLIAALALTCGCVCLLKDLTRSGQAFYLLVKPTLSAISIGAYSLIALTILIVGLYAVTYRRRDAYHLKLTLLAGAAAAVLAIVVVLYTGVLLQSIAAVPFWRSPLVMPIFAASSFSSGIGCFALVNASVFRERTLLLEEYGMALNVDTAVLLAEVVFIACFAFGLVDAYGPDVLANFMPGGSCLQAFWAGVVALGIVSPLILYRMPFSHIRTGYGLFLTAGCASVAGAFFLRYCFIFGGIHISSIILLGV